MNLERVSKKTFDFIESSCPPKERAKWAQNGYPKIKVDKEFKISIYLPRTNIWYYYD